MDALRFVESCIDRYAEQAWRAAYVMLSNAADADDLLQQAFLVAWRKSDAAPRDNAWPWLAAIIANEARNFRRKRSRRRAASLDSVSEPAMNNDPDQQLQRAELSALVHVSLAQLSEDQRIAIVLTHLSGLSQAQAADALGVPLNTLKARVRRGLDALRDTLGKNAPSLEGTLKNLPVAPPVGGFIAAKAAWTAGLAGNVAVAGTATAAGATVSVKLLVAASVTALILSAAIAGAALSPNEEPRPYLAPDVRDIAKTPPAPTPTESQPPTPKQKNDPEPAPQPTRQPAPVSPPAPEPAPEIPEPEPIKPEPAPEPYRPAPAPAYRGPASPPSDADSKREQLFGMSFGEKIEQAVEKGCEWLKKQQGIDTTAPKEVFGGKPENPTYESGTPHQYWIARTAFPVQALCTAGCFVDDPEIDSAMTWLRENYTENGSIGGMQGFVASSTYEDATVLLAVEAYYISAWETHDRGLDNPKKRYTKDDDGNKVPISRWGTAESSSKRSKKPVRRNFKLDRKDQKICEIAVKALESRFRKGAYGGGGWRYAKPGTAEQDPLVDVSATQYALIGLKAATRLGIKYEKSVLLEVFRFLRGQQDKDGPEVKVWWKTAYDGKRHGSSEGDPDEERDGVSDSDGTNDRGNGDEPNANVQTLHARGWGYCRGSSHRELDKTTYGSMTAAAINSLILIRDELVDDPGHRRVWAECEDDCNLMIGDGVAWLVSNWSMKENPQALRHHYYYYLRTIERLGMLASIDEFASHDWYLEGADVLLQEQTIEGSSNGAWDVGNEIDPSAVYNTCHALLFLKRATQHTEWAIPALSADK